MMNIIIKRAKWTLQNSNKYVKSAEYAVRGAVPTRAAVLQQQIGKQNLPFNQITYCNIGNPQEFGQKPITFYRQVLACVMEASLLNVTNRAKKYLEEIISVGSYTPSIGIKSIRQNISKFIHKQYQVPIPDPSNIFLTQGASQGVSIVLNTLIRNRDDVILVPVPQYPLYSAVIQLCGGTLAPFYLNEQKGWQLDVEELKQSIADLKNKGMNVRALVAINPGNPTGSILDKKSIENILNIASDNNIVVIADQVYRQNIYKAGSNFLSFRQILGTMPIKDKVQLITLNSASKGLMGQCGLRGGYLELLNIDPQVYSLLVKLKSINLCSNSIGQIAMDLLVNPPIENVLPQTKQLFLKEKKDLYLSLKKRSQLVYNQLKSMKNIEIAPVQGAMYAFPRIHLSQKALEAAKKKDLQGDMMFCMQLLQRKGIALVPGSGFKQRPGTYHFRITTLILPQDKLIRKLKDLSQFNQEFHQRYS